MTCGVTGEAMVERERERGERDTGETMVDRERGVRETQGRRWWRGRRREG
jgi:hypothetical protein